MSEDFKQELGCNYHGQVFGAEYPDACCIEGYLWDEDSGDASGLTHGGDIPCPNCNEQAAVRLKAEALLEEHRVATLRAGMVLAREIVHAHVAEMKTKWGFFAEQSAVSTPE